MLETQSFSWPILFWNKWEVKRELFCCQNVLVMKVLMQSGLTATASLFSQKTSKCIKYSLQLYNFIRQLLTVCSAFITHSSFTFSVLIYRASKCSCYPTTTSSLPQRFIFLSFSWLKKYFKSSGCRCLILIVFLYQFFFQYYTERIFKT